MASDSIVLKDIKIRIEYILFIVFLHQLIVSIFHSPGREKLSWHSF